MKKKRGQSLAILCISFLCLLVLGCPEAIKLISVASVSIDKAEASLKEGETLQLTAAVSPSDASNKAVSWTSSDSSIASVSSSGLVTAVSAGNADITVTTEDGSKTAVCAVTVTPVLVPVESVALSVNSAEMKTGETLQLAATVSPSDSSNKAVSWTSSNVSIASVSSSGLVTAVSAGSANITVTTEEGSKTAVCAVTVTTALVPVESIALSVATAEMTTGQTLQLSAIVTPANAYPVELEWFTNNYNAEVENGLVTAKDAGTVKIFARSSNYKIGECLINITTAAVPVTSVIASQESITLVPGETDQLSASVLPSNASIPNVVWSSSDTSVATVSADGLVTAVSGGSAVITAASADGSKTDTVAVTVAASGICVIFEGPADEYIDMTAPKDVLRKSSWDSIKISVAGEWDSYEWCLNGVLEGALIESYMYFHSSENPLGYHELTVIVGKGSAYYSKSLKLRVIE
jgi:uncharacterized protein YjdB